MAFISKYPPPITPGVIGGEVCGVIQVEGVTASREPANNALRIGRAIRMRKEEPSSLAEQLVVSIQPLFRIIRGHVDERFMEHVHRSWCWILRIITMGYNRESAPLIHSFDVPVVADDTGILSQPGRSTDSAHPVVIAGARIEH